MMMQRMHRMEIELEELLRDAEIRRRLDKLTEPRDPNMDGPRRSREPGRNQRD